MSKEQPFLSEPFLASQFKIPGKAAFTDTRQFTCGCPKTGLSLTGFSLYSLPSSHHPLHLEKRLGSVGYITARLCFRSAQVPQATNFCLWATGKTFFFHICVSAGHPGFHG